MKWVIHLTVFVFLLTIIHPCIAQNNSISFYNLDSINGSPLGKITGIAQDPNGYMWFCGQGQNCLYRYDGTSIISYKHDNKNSNTLGFKVKDNGKGIPGKVLDKIFQPFFTTKPTGLGLSLSFDIVKAHGGEIKIDTVEGEYTAFIVSLRA